MHIEKQYITERAKRLLRCNNFAALAYKQIQDSVCSMVDSINCSEKNYNGVVPLKEPCYKTLEETYGWYREKPLDILSEKGGPIDVFQLFQDDHNIFRVGLEFETGNISSAHRSMNKLSLGISASEIDMAVLLMPMHKLSYYLTDRVSNYEELEPYFPLIKDVPFIVIGFDVEDYSTSVDGLSKGKDGMSKRSVHKWKSRV